MLLCLNYAQYENVKTLRAITSYSCLCTILAAFNSRHTCRRICLAVYTWCYGILSGLAELLERYQTYLSLFVYFLHCHPY